MPPHQGLSLIASHHQYKKENLRPDLCTLMSVLGDELPTATSEDFGFKPLGKIDILPSYEEQLPFSKLQNLAISNISKLYAAATNQKVVVGTLHNLRSQLPDAAGTDADASEEPRQLQFLSEKDLECVVYVGFNSAGTAALCITKDFGLFRFDVSQKEWSSLNISLPTSQELTVTSVKPLSPDLQILLVQASNQLYQVEISGSSSVIANDITDFDVGHNQYVLMHGDGTIEIHKDFQEQSPKTLTPPDDVLEQISEECVPLAIEVLSELRYLVVFGNPVTESDEDVMYDHRMFLVTLTGNNEAKFQESFDIAPAFGSVLRTPNYYRISLNQLMPSLPHLYVISSAASSELTLLDDNAVIQPNQDSDRAVLPINQDTDNDTNPVGMAVDLTSELQVAEPCQGVNVSNNLPIVFVLNSEGELLVFALFNSSGIKKNEFTAEGAFNALRSEWKASEEMLSTKLKTSTDKETGSSETSGGSRPPTDSSTGTSIEISGSDDSSITAQPSSPSIKSSSPQPFEGQQKSSPFTGQLTSEQSSFGKPSFGQPSFGQSSSGQSSFGQSSYGQTSFGKSSLGQSSFGQPSFGQSSFGQSASEKSTFGQPSFGQTAFGKHSLEQPVAGQQAFGKPSFGQPAFGQSVFGKSSVDSSATKSAQSLESKTPALGSDREAVSGAKDTSSQLTQTKPLFGNTTFGQSTPTKPLTDSSMSTPGAGSFGKPAFGKPAFGSGFQFGTSNPQINSDGSKDTASSQPAFKAPAFGAPAFGTPAFGQTSIGSHESKPQVTGTENSTGSGFGAFSAFAKTDSPFSKLSSGPSPFINKPVADKPESNESEGKETLKSKPDESSSIGSEHGFGIPSKSLFSKTAISNSSSVNSSASKSDSKDNASSLFSNFNDKIAEHKQSQSPFSQFQNQPVPSATNNEESTNGDESHQAEDSDSSSDKEASTGDDASSTESSEDAQSQPEHDEQLKLTKEGDSGNSDQVSKEQHSLEPGSNKTDFSSLTERIKKVANIDGNSFSDAFSKSMTVKEPEASQTGASAFSKFSKDLQKSPKPAFSFANIGKQQSLNTDSKLTNSSNNLGRSTPGERDTEKDSKVNRKESQDSKKSEHQSAAKEEGSEATTTFNKSEGSFDQKGANEAVLREGKALSGKESDELGESDTWKPSAAVSQKETTDEYCSSEVDSKEASKEVSEESPVNLPDTEYSGKRTETSTEGESFDDLDDLKEELEHIKTNTDKIKMPTSSEHATEPAHTNPRFALGNSSTETFDAKTQTFRQVHDAEVGTEKNAVDHADVQAFENDEKYLAQQYAPKKIGTFFIGAKLLQKPSLSKNETMKRIEATFNVVSSELEVLEGNLKNIGEFINDQSKNPFSRTAETLFLNYTWRLEEASVLNSFVKELFEEGGSTFAEVSSLMCDAENLRDKDLVSLKSNQFSTREYFCQLKTLCEQNETFKRGLTFRQTQFQRKLRSKISSVQNLIHNMGGTLRVLKAQASTGDVKETPLVSRLIESSSRRGDLLEAIQALRSEVAELKIRDRSLIKFSDADSATRTAPISELKLKLDTKQQIGQVLMNRLQNT
ncbi:hypothetical protein ACU8KH_04943 [Lachancea thermotolerans]